ncbi:hypothetical protein E2562_008229 [Oryza meyeriana var. granulata]|uniref:Ubiquitin-like protease family profile domain-containing protein n=1 Tax=Oryza meyeriana var. granulata TaxID=110450 RepID=A0A6G1DG03_9ORYZ|nr:hypothetical protein E2562_008229 [Oryza meyeriana var. granulata]KAF0911341.1 hypothetical protein E2562_008229 [Oryza meyeriana var. granulata]
MVVGEASSEFFVVGGAAAMGALTPVRDLGKKHCLIHNEGDINEQLSSGSDTDDIILLKKKFKCLKKKHAECIDNLKKHRLDEKDFVTSLKCIALKEAKFQRREHKKPPNQVLIKNRVKTPVATSAKNVINLVSPEVSAISCNSFDVRCVDACIQAEKIYHQRISTGHNFNFAMNLTSAEVGPFYATPVNVLQPLDQNAMVVASSDNAGGSSTCKMPAHGKRRQVMGSKFTMHPYVNWNSKFNVSRIDKAYYDAVICMSKGKNSSLKAIRLHQDGPPFVTFSCLGHSLNPDGKIDNFLFNAFCHILFLENHPSKSRKHYFFNTVGNHFLKSENEFKACDMKYEFQRAQKAKSLQSCEMIHFPILYEDHWFLFIADIKDRTLVFLDSLHVEDSTYHKGVKTNIIANFTTAFSEYAKRSTINFGDFDTQYHRPHKQTRDKDSGIFVMMYMEHWGPRVALEAVFDVNDIPNIRITLLNRMIHSKHNLEDMSLLHSIVTKLFCEIGC